MIELAEAAHDLAALLESTARGLNHPRHSQHVAPARRRIKAVMVHYFERQRRAVLSAVKPKISRELLLYQPIREIKEGWVTIDGRHVFIADSPEEQDEKNKGKEEHVSFSGGGPKEVISGIISKGEYGTYGLRVVANLEDQFTHTWLDKKGLPHTSGKLSVGDTAPASYQWRDGELTNKKLTGTSAIKVTAKDMEDAIKLVQQYVGEQVVLMGTNSAHRGHDPGETVMNGAKVLAVWSKKGGIHGTIESQRTHVLTEASLNGKTFAKQLLPATLQPLTFAATRGEDTEYTDAVTELIAAAAQSLEATASGGSFAEQYLRDNSLSKLTGGLNKTSIERLQDALANAWDAGGDYNSMVKAITDTFENFSTKRADLIAQTESADAYNAGRQTTALAIGMDEHSWETESDDPCPVCLANEAQGWIDIGDNFDSGDEAPTAHPNCLCVVNFRKSD